jgi:hypothetical protein
MALDELSRLLRFFAARRLVRQRINLIRSTFAAIISRPPNFFLDAAQFIINSPAKLLPARSVSTKSLAETIFQTVRQ